MRFSTQIPAQKIYQLELVENSKVLDQKYIKMTSFRLLLRRAKCIFEHEGQ